MLQCVALFCSALTCNQRMAVVHLEKTMTDSMSLQCVAISCSVLQCVAICYSVLQCFAL